MAKTTNGSQVETKNELQGAANQAQIWMAEELVPKMIVFWQQVQTRLAQEKLTELDVNNVFAWADPILIAQATAAVRDKVNALGEAIALEDRRRAEAAKSP